MPWTFYNSNGQRLSSAATLIDNLDIDGATALSGAVADADLFIVDDNASGANRKVTAATIKTYIGSVSQASSGAIVAQTNEDTYVPPDLVKNSPGVAKAWGKISTTGSLGSPDHGVASVAKGATGKYVITFDTAFASAVYAVNVTNESGAAIFGSKSTAAADTAAIDIWTHAGAAVDAAFYFTAFGTLS
jgi:hypothetical protein|tara:strand:- start:446 stop:1012 length:567 start_codon:yes stop_codon:yes gene_type:complete